MRVIDLHLPTKCAAPYTRKQNSYVTLWWRTDPWTIPTDSIIVYMCMWEGGKEHTCVFRLKIRSFVVLSLFQSRRPYVRVCSDTLNLQVNAFVHCAVVFWWFFFTSREGWEDTTSAKNISPADFSYNPPRKKKKADTHTQTQSHAEIKACQKETDLPRLTQVQMSQCGWISFGIVSVPSFDKEVFFCRRDETRQLARALGRHGNAAGFVREDTGEPT